MTDRSQNAPLAAHGDRLLPPRSSCFLAQAVAWICVVFLCALGSAAPALAEGTPKGVLTDTMIQWGDYDQFNIQGPRAVRACQEACDRDPRCRAWTFIKTTSACRLKHEPGLAVQNSCCASGYRQLSAPTPTDPAYARQEFCAEYARIAVRAQDDNLKQACGLTGTRWTASYRDHYAYCLRAPRVEIDDETSVRMGEIQRCAASADRGVDAKCDHYVRATMVQVESARAGNCAIDPRDPRWAPNVDTHERACRAAPNRVLDAAIEAREKLLAQCFEVAGQPQDSCVAYAASAVAQFQQNLDNGCNFAGARWHSGKSRHYQWCMTQSVQTRTAETQARRGELSRCVQQAPRTQRCSEYARTAMQAALRNDNIGCRLGGPGNRWSRYRDDHEEYCLTATDAALRGEAAARTKELARCEAKLRQVNDVCDQYAKRSNRLSLLNEENGCGAEGDPWGTDERSHYTYCLGANIEERQAVLQAKRRAISRCSTDRGFTLRLEF
jgi:PAN domain